MRGRTSSKPPVNDEMFKDSILKRQIFKDMKRCESLIV